MALSFNFAPYFDDFDPAKHFYRVIFRPAQGVQVRELNQMQSILQEQVSRFGAYFFKHGAMVIPGQVGFDAKLAYVRLKSISRPFDPLIIGKQVFGLSSGLVAEIRAYTPATVNDPDTIYVKYLNSNVAGDLTFQVGEQLLLIDADTSIAKAEAAAAELAAATVQLSTGVGSVSTLDPIWHVTSPLGGGSHAATIIDWNPYWRVPSEGYNWISASGATQSMPLGDYTYNTGFSIDNGSTSAIFEYTIAADDLVKSFTLTGPGGYVATKDYSALNLRGGLADMIDNLPGDGSYGLTIVVENQASAYSGLQLSTGQGAVGSLDTLWQVKAPNRARRGAALIIDPMAHWFTPPSGAKWIGSVADQDVVGVYEYSAQFNVDTGTNSSTFTYSIGADNRVKQLVLTGPQGFKSTKTYSGQHFGDGNHGTWGEMVEDSIKGMPDGDYTLTVQVENTETVVTDQTPVDASTGTGSWTVLTPGSGTFVAANVITKDPLWIDVAGAEWVGASSNAVTQGIYTFKRDVTINASANNGVFNYTIAADNSIRKITLTGPDGYIATRDYTEQDRYSEAITDSFYELPGDGTYTITVDVKNLPVPTRIQTESTVMLNTGFGVIGSNDNRWTVKVPGSGSFVPAHVIARDASWMVEGVNQHWISAGTSSADAVPAGTYTFKTEFEFASGSDSGVLNFTVAANDAIRTVKLEGPSSYSSTKTYSDLSNYHNGETIADIFDDLPGDGSYTLTITVENNAGPAVRVNLPTISLNSGSGIVGSTDTKWTVKRPFSGTWDPVYAVGGGAGWFSAPAGSHWVSPDHDNNALAKGVYEYATTFNITGGADLATLTLDIGADNILKDLVLTGPGGYSVTRTYGTDDRTVAPLHESITNLPGDGTYWLKIKVENYPVPQRVQTESAQSIVTGQGGGTPGTADRRWTVLNPDAPSAIPAPLASHPNWFAPDAGTSWIGYTAGANAALPLDVVILCDTTGSMGATIQQIKTNIDSIVDDVFNQSDNAKIAIAQYRDWGDSFVYAVPTPLSDNKTVIHAAVQGLVGGEGADTPESNLYALKQVADTMNWRAGSMRLIFWFGDSSGHSPSPDASQAYVPGTSGVTPVTLDAAANALTAKGIKVYATNVNGLNGGGDGLNATGQAQFFATATGGAYFNALSGSEIASIITDTIAGLVQNGGAPAGDYTFSTTFSIRTGSDSASFVYSLGSDNSCLSVTVTGPSGFHASRSHLGDHFLEAQRNDVRNQTFTGLPGDGDYTITVVVNNAYVPTGNAVGLWFSAVVTPAIVSDNISTQTGLLVANATVSPSKWNYDIPSSIGLLVSASAVPSILDPNHPTSSGLAMSAVFVPRVIDPPPGSGFMLKGSVAPGTPTGLLLDNARVIPNVASTWTVDINDPLGLTVSAGIEQGVYFYNGLFVSVDKQLLLLNKYNNLFTGTVGLKVVESIITEDDDISLLEPEQTSPNYTAPGAHRYKVEMFLEARDYDNPVTSDFIELLKLTDSAVVTQVTKTDYDIIHQTLARRTKDQWGDYAKTQFGIDVREHLDTSWVAAGTAQAGASETFTPPVPANITLAFLSSNVDNFYQGFTIHLKTGVGGGQTRTITSYNGASKIAYVDKNWDVYKTPDNTTEYTINDPSKSNRGIFSPADGGSESKLAVGIEAGKAYVNGYEVNNQHTTYIPIDKARSTETHEGSTFAEYGSYLFVKNLHAMPVPSLTQGRDYLQISIMGTKATGTYSANDEIGTARVRDIEFAFGPNPNDSNAVFRIYLQDIAMKAGYDIDFARSFFLTSGTNNQNGLNAWGDIVTVFDMANVVGQGFVAGNDITGPNGIGTEVVVLWDSLNGVVFTEPKSGNPQQITSLGPVSATGSSTANISTRTQLFDGSLFMNVWPLGRTVVNSLHPGAKLTAQPTAVTNNTLRFPSSASNANDFYINNNVRIISGPGVGQMRTITDYVGSTRTATFDSAWDVGNLPTTSSIFVCMEPTIVNYHARKVIQATGVNGTFTFSSTDPFVHPFNAYDFMAVCIAKGGGSPSFNVGEVIDLGLYAPEYPVTNPQWTQFAVQIGSSTDTLRLVATVNKTAQNEKYKVWTPYSVGDTTTWMPYTSGTGAGVLANEIGLEVADVRDFRVYQGVKTWEIPFNAYTNTFTPGMQVVGVTSGARGQVLDFDTIGEILTLTSVSGTFLDAETIECMSDQTITANTDGPFTVVYATPDLNSDPVNYVEVTDNYSLDDGQRDTHYQLAKIIRKPGYPVPPSDTNLLITWDYFKHVGTGDFFSVDSYLGQVAYQDIPVYENSLGRSYPLRDSLDFRPTISSNGLNFHAAGSVWSDPLLVGDQITYSSVYYLDRIDKIFLAEDGTFKVNRGTSSLTPVPPENIPNTMLLYTLHLDAYTMGPKAVKAKMTDNRGYTMRDIGKLEKRIENLEYYTQLNLLEQDTAKHQVRDTKTGLDRYKNGFVVDNFKSHGTGNVWDVDYNCAVDNAVGELRPQYYQDNVGIEYVSDQSTGVIRVGTTLPGDILMLPYSHEAVVSQPLSTRVENVNPFTNFGWGGSLELIPPSDEWRDTARRPDVLVNDDNAMRYINRPLGVVWNEWQTNWTGEWSDTSARTINSSSTSTRSSDDVITNTTNTTTEVTQTRDVQQSRSGTRTTVVPQTVRVDTVDRVVNVETIPFIRSRVVQFIGKRMKPKTRVYPYFDGRFVGQWVRPTRVPGLTPYIIPFDEAPIQADNNALGLTSDTSTPSETLAAGSTDITNINTGAPLVRPTGNPGPSGEATTNASSSDRTTPPTTTGADLTSGRMVPNDTIDRLRVVAPGVWSLPATFIQNNIDIGKTLGGAAQPTLHPFTPMPLVVPTITARDINVTAIRDAHTELTGRTDREWSLPTPAMTVAGTAITPTVTFRPSPDCVVVKVSGDSQAIMASQTFPQPLVVQVNRSGIPVSGATVQWKVTGPAIVSGLGTREGVVATDAVGRAQVTVTASDAPGAIVVTADIGGTPIQFNLSTTFNTNRVTGAVATGPAIIPTGAFVGGGAPTTVVMGTETTIDGVNPATTLFRTNTTGGDRGVAPIAPTPPTVASDLLSIQTSLQKILEAYGKDPTALLGAGHQVGVPYYVSELGKNYTVVGYTSTWQPIVIVPRSDASKYATDVYSISLSTGALAYIVNDEGYAIFKQQQSGTAMMMPGVQITWLGGTTGRNDTLVRIFQPGAATTVTTGVVATASTALTSNQLNDARAVIMANPGILLQISGLTNEEQHVSSVTEINNLLVAKPEVASAVLSGRTDTSTSSITTSVQSGSARFQMLDDPIRIDPATYSLSQSTLAPTATIPTGTAFGNEPKYGDPLYTNGVGTVTGEFWIPNTDAIHFRVGRRLFRLTSSPNNNKNAETWADAVYSAQGTLYTNQRTVTSIREPHYVVENLYDSASYTETQTDLRFESQSWDEPAPQPIEPPAPVVIDHNPTPVITEATRTTTEATRTTTEVAPPATEPEPPVFEPPIEEPPPPAPDPPPPVVLSVTTTTTSTSTWFDPLAETFLVDTKGGYFLSKIDLFFASIDPRMPVTVQIRTTVNGYPSKKVLPFAEKTMYPETGAIKVSDDGSIPTTFEFPVPVYLEENQEYAFVVMANTNNYLLHTARMGERAFTTGAVVNQQPYAGVMFKSQNASTWSADQLEDIKFTIYRAKFDVSSQATVYFRNKDLDTVVLGNNPFHTAQGSDIVRVLHSDNGMVRSNDKGSVVTIGHVQDAPINGIPAAALVGDFTVESVDLDAYTIKANLAGDFDKATISNGISGPSLVEVSREFQYNLMHPTFGTMIMPGTGISWFARTISGKAVHNNELATQTPFQKSDFVAIVPNTNIEYSVPQMIATTKTETLNVVGNSPFDRRSLLFRAVMFTTQDNLTPMVDLQRMSAIVVHNRLDDPNFNNQTLPLHDKGVTFTATSDEFIEFGGYDHLEVTGVAESGGATSINIGSLGVEIDDYYVNMSVKVIAGSGQGEEKIITAYSALTRDATVDSAWHTNPDSTSQFEIWRGQSMHLRKKVLSATATRGANSSVNIAGPVTAPDVYKGMIVRIVGGTGAGQEREIISYQTDGSHSPEGKITVDSPWLVNPSNTSSIIILSYGTDLNFDNMHAGRGIVISGANNSANNHDIDNTVQIIKVTRNIMTCNTTFKPEKGSGGVVITAYDKYISEEASGGCSASSRYITKRFTLNQSANSLRLTLSISRPVGSFVDVYYKTLLMDAGSHFDDVPYTYMELEPGVNMEPQDDFVDYNFVADEIGDFTTFCFKIVMRGGNTSKVPRIRDLRGIALGT